MKTAEALGLTIPPSQRLRALGLGVLLLVIALLVAPLAVDAQQAGRVWRIGFISTSTLVDAVVDGFRQGLREDGYIEGQNLRIDWRFAEGKGADRLPGLATDLVSCKVEVIVTAGNLAALAAKRLRPYFIT